MRHARVVLDHRVSQRPPIRVLRGDAVVLGERDSEWPSFVWTVPAGDDPANAHGGWVPAILFDRDHGRALALADYDTRELDADAGTLLTLHRELGGWWWAENDNGAQGWVPARNLETIEETPA